jgi:ferritin-like metal-binding protein YciE
MTNHPVLAGTTPASVRSSSASGTTTRSYAASAFCPSVAGETGSDRHGERSRTVTALDEKLVEYIDDAYAMEQNVLRMLDGMIGTTEDPQMKRALERHKKQTERQAERLKERLRDHGSSPSAVKEAGGVVGALMKSVVDVARGDKAGRNARDGYATEHMEIASYEMLERVARMAGDKETAAVARQNREEEEAMARSIASKWKKIVELSLKEEGVRVS